MAKISRIAPEIPAADLQSALEHYELKLGFQVAMQMPGGDYAIVERDGAAIHLFEDNTRSHSPVGLHIFTSDLEALYSEFQQSGAHLTQEIVRKPWGNRDFRLQDDFGNEIKFTEPLSDEAVAGESAG
jgi:uncharacterized glyoxalase superfamily protein PhnB